MSKALTSGLMVVMLVLSLAPAAALADSTYANTVIDYSPGTQKGGAAIPGDRNDPNAALGAPDGNFVSLGYGGELVLEFDTFVGGSLEITVYETTYGDYPLEEAEVYVSTDNLNWDYLGVADNMDEGDTSSSTFFELADTCVKYVKLVDVTDAELHNNSSDGFDVEAVHAEYTSVCEEEEEECDCNGPTWAPVFIKNSNMSYLSNSAFTYANSGNNSAEGGNGGQAGSGGDVENSQDDNTGGNGGNGGNGGDGGGIETGAASAFTGISNDVNHVTTRIDRACGCDEECACGPTNRAIMLFNDNNAITMNGAPSIQVALVQEVEQPNGDIPHIFGGIYTEANTGDNDVDGGGESGKHRFPRPVLRGFQESYDHSSKSDNDGGDVENSEDDNTGGNGGRSGAGGNGGVIITGPSTAITDIMNRVNTIVSNILR